MTAPTSNPSTLAAHPAPGCRKCAAPVTCHPTGHHCGACGHHDDTACEKHPEPQTGEEAWHAETVIIPKLLFDALACGYRRRNLYRTAIHRDTPMALAIRELAAAQATGSTRLTPMAAYRLAQNLVSIVAGAEERAEDEDLFWGVLNAMTDQQRAACRAVDEAESAASMAEYRAWRAEQLAAQGVRREPR